MSAPVAPLVPLRIRLPYSAESEFVARYGSNVSRGGIFIATRSLKSEGTPLAFELLLKTGVVLLRGEAVVAKTQVDSGGGRSGMTLRFVRLDGPSRAVVERVLAERGASSRRAPLASSGVQRPGRSELSKRIDAALAAEEGSFPEAAESASSEPSPEERTSTTGEPDGLAGADGRSSSPSSEMDLGEAGAPADDDSADALSAFAADAQSAPTTDAQTQLAPDPQTQFAAELPSLAPEALPPAEDRGSAAPDQRALSEAGESSHSDADAIALTVDEVIPLSLDDEATPDAVIASGPEPTSSTHAPSALAPEVAPDELEASAPSSVSALAQTPPPDDSASPTGIADPLELPSLPERPASLLEPVLGIELVGAFARVGVWSAGVTSQLALAPEGSFPMLACLQGDRWQLGRGAAGREDALPLFAPPTDLLPRARNGLGERQLAFGGRDVPATRVGANLFALLRAEIEQALGKPVRDVMFVVPSWFSYRDRLLLSESAQLGGLRALQLLHATSAACASFAQERGLARKRVLVLHAEPAHFEAAIIQVTGDDLEVISTQSALPMGEAVGLDQLAEVTRAVLAAAGASIESLDEVVQFGDPTALARAAPPLTELLGRPLPEPLDDAAAVRGAALLGHAHAELARGRHGGCAFEVLVSPLSLVQRDGTLRRVLEVGTRLPAEKALSIPLAASELLALIFCDGPGGRIDEADVIGAANVESGPMGGELSVRVTVDRNGQLGLSTSLSGGRAEVRPLTLPAQPARKSGFLRGIVQKLGKG
jgi:uncharacterized protein (TIGR02266 family)